MTKRVLRSGSENSQFAIRNPKFYVFLCAMLFALISVTVSISVTFLAGAQQPKIYRIGVLLPGGPLYDTVDGLRAGLKELGLEEGKHVLLTIHDTKGDGTAGKAAAKQIEQDKFQLIYAIGSSVIVAAKQGTHNIPIVFSIGSDPVALGLVKEFAKPQGRLTGVHYLVKDLTAKRMELLKEMLPKINRVVTLYDPGNAVASEAVLMARLEAKRLGIKLIEQQVTSAERLRSGLNGLKAGEADAFFYVPDTMVVGQAQFIIDTARAKKLPTMFQDESLVANGALASYGQNYHEIGRLSAKYVQRVLTGTPPGELRVETADNVELAVNLRTAKELGVTIPAHVLARAKKVIK
jgi:putative tryptophan/tyrosine transport system substrate-binding protein